ncbi:MAG: prepilin-type N-terminal cleavage/methylation domain-containing protein [Synechococcus sp.]
MLNHSRLLSPSQKVSSHQGFSQQGFTLPELLAGVAIVSILLGIGGLTLMNQREPLRTATNDVEGAFKQARARAMATTSACTVQPDPDNPTTALSVQCAPNCASPAGAWVDQPNLDIALDDGVQLANGGWQICFNSRGLSNTAGAANLSLTEDGNTTTSQVAVLLGGVISNSFTDSIPTLNAIASTSTGDGTGSGTTTESTSGGSSSSSSPFSGSNWNANNYATDAAGSNYSGNSDSGGSSSGDTSDSGGDTSGSGDTTGGDTSGTGGTTGSGSTDSGNTDSGNTDSGDTNSGGQSSSVLGTTITDSSGNTRSALSDPWSGASGGDIGGPNNPGSHNFDPDTGALSFEAGGRDIWNQSDEFHFVSTEITGDATIIAQVTSLNGDHPWAKAGIMMRESLDADSRHSHMLVSNGGGGYSFQHRGSTGGNSASAKNTSLGGSSPAPGWIMLERTGNTFSGFASEDGINWVSVGNSVTLNNMPDTIHVGMAVTSHENNDTATADFSDMMIYQ